MLKLISWRNEIAFSVKTEKTSDSITRAVTQHGATALSTVASWVDDATIRTKVPEFMSLKFSVTG